MWFCIMKLVSVKYSLLVVEPEGASNMCWSYVFSLVLRLLPNQEGYSSIYETLPFSESYKIFTEIHCSLHNEIRMS